PTARKYERQACRGVLIDIADSKSLRPVRLGLYLIAASIRMHPKEFTFAPYPTAANETGGGHLDRLVGIPIRSDLESGKFDLESMTSPDSWADRVSRKLLY